MANVRIRMTRGSGREILRPKHVAAKLVRAGFYEYVEAAPVPAPPPPPQPVPEPTPEPTPESTGDDLEDMAYNDLRSLAVEEGVSPEGRKKEDYIAALQAGRYIRRDMQAEE